MSCFLPRKTNPEHGLGDFGPSKCQSHLAKMCDINNVIARAIAGDTSVIRRGSYVDVSDAPESLQEALNVNCRAIEAYNALPEAVRARWTTPAAFLAALETPECKQEFVKLGLAFERTPEGPIEVKVINQSPSVKTAETSTVSA